MSPTVVNLIKSLPAAARPESDAYMTALAIVVLRQSRVPVADVRIQRGLAWLKREQRASGRWWMNSRYRGNDHYITYIAGDEKVKMRDLVEPDRAESGDLRKPEVVPEGRIELPTKGL